MTKLSDILRGIDDRKMVAVPTPEWPELDGKLFAKRLSPSERVAYWEASKTLPKDIPLTVAVAVLGTVDADGVRAFDNDDAAWIATDKAATPIERLCDKIDELNTITRFAESELEKNCETPRNC